MDLYSADFHFCIFIVGAAVAVVGLAAYRAYAARRNTSS